MAQGFLVDAPVMMKAATDFDNAADGIRGLMTRLNSDVTALVGQTQNFDGAARIAFDQNHRLLSEKITAAQQQLNVIAQQFTDVMNTHAAFSDEQKSRIQQVVGALSSNPVASGLND